jgi:hypothetical protein
MVFVLFHLPRTYHIARISLNKKNIKRDFPKKKRKKTGIVKKPLNGIPLIHYNTDLNIRVL